MTDSVLSAVAEVLEPHGMAWGLAPLDPAPFLSRMERFDGWFSRGMHAGMDWLWRSREARARPWTEWPWARSFLVVELPYDLPRPAARGERPQVAGYARKRDYHHRMDGILKKVQASLEARFPGLQSFRFCDDQHLPEVELAVLAGLGWRGKNTLLLGRRGSAFHLGGLLLSLEGVEAPDPHPDRCGSCTACLEACPAGALPKPGLLDSGRCISHWNIEDRRTGEGPAAMAARSEVFGCDICQQACPWNRKSMTEDVDPEGWPASWEQWVALCRPGGGFQSLFTKTPLRRSGRHKTLKVLLRALENVDPALAGRLREAALETETYPELVSWLRSGGGTAEPRSGQSRSESMQSP
jgi:epoxyqueuosine reductase